MGSSHDGRLRTDVRGCNRLRREDLVGPVGRDGVDPVDSPLAPFEDPHTPARFDGPSMIIAPWGVTSSVTCGMSRLWLHITVWSGRDASCATRSGGDPSGSSWLSTSTSSAWWRASGSTCQCSAAGGWTGRGRWGRGQASSRSGRPALGIGRTADGRHHHHPSGRDGSGKAVRIRYRATEGGGRWLFGAAPYTPPLVPMGRTVLIRSPLTHPLGDDQRATDDHGDAEKQQRPGEEHGAILPQLGSAPPRTRSGSMRA